MNHSETCQESLNLRGERRAELMLGWVLRVWTDHPFLWIKECVKAAVLAFLPVTLGPHFLWIRVFLIDALTFLHLQAYVWMFCSMRVLRDELFLKSCVFMLPRCCFMFHQQHQMCANDSEFVSLLWKYRLGYIISILFIIYVYYDIHFIPLMGKNAFCMFVRPWKWM